MRDIELINILNQMKESSESPFRPKSSRTFSNAKLTSFPQLPPGVYYDQVTITSPNITSFQNYSNFIKSYRGNTPSLVLLKLSNTGIATYKGAQKTPSLKYIFLANTPLSRYHYYRVMTIIAFGSDTLEEIDHIPIKKSERTFSKVNADLLYPYLIDGWLLTMVDPIRIFDPVTRRRRVLYNKSTEKQSTSNKKPAGRQSLAANSTINAQLLADNIQAISKATSHPNAQSSEQASKEQQDRFSKDGIDFLQYLEQVFFESDFNELFKSKNQKQEALKKSNSKSLDSIVSDLKLALSNSNSRSDQFDSNSSLFVNFLLRSVALRPLYVDSIVKLLKLIITDEVLEILKQSLFHVNFYSNSALANFIESLLDQGIFTNEDIKPLFFSVYEKFEDWNSPFSLTSTEDEEISHAKLLRIPFIDFFCPFAKIIEQVDPELYNDLLEQAGESEKAKIELYKKNDEKKKDVWDALAKDDYTKFSFSSTENPKEADDQHSENNERNDDKGNGQTVDSNNNCLFGKDLLKQCVVDLTPWDVQEQQIEIAFAFSGSPQCLFHSSLFNQNKAESLSSNDLLKVSTVAGGSFVIFNRLFKSDSNNINNAENEFELAESAIQFHRFDIFKEIAELMFQDYSKLDSLIEVAIDSMEVNVIKYIICDKKVEIEKDYNESLFNRAIASSIPNVSSDLDPSTKSRFMNPLNSLISGFLLLQKAFIIFLYNIGFRSPDSLIFSIQAQSLDLVRFFINCHKNANLIANQKEVNIINRRGNDHLRWTPLHVAANSGNVLIVRELKKVSGINVNLRDADGNTPLMIAVSNNFEEIVQELLKSKKKSINGMKNRSKSLNAESIKSSSSIVDPNIADKYGWTPLFVAIGNKNISIVKMLLGYDKGGKFTNVNQIAIVGQNNDDDDEIDMDNHSSASTEMAASAGRGMTPLSLAVDVGDEDIFNLLLQRDDIDVNAKSLGGDSPLSIAVKKRNLIFINGIISTKKVKKDIVVDAVKEANSLGLTEIAQLLHNIIH
ncbi:hypothetical protein M9Y10_038132 [Tritrichomonas musculus]|uniref:Ankyrin repeat protein n=1 Tax=Tritrichomonas musculus TaxID=1915356 RepID=A0ABR2K7K1_9EUKA